MQNQAGRIFKIFSELKTTKQNPTEAVKEEIISFAGVLQTGKQSEKLFNV